MHLHVRTCTPLFQISQTAGRIAFKFGLWLGVGTHQTRALHKSEVGCICTCARTRPFVISRKRLGGLCSNFVCDFGPIRYVLYMCLRWSASARAHVHTCTPLSRYRKRLGGLRSNLFVASDPLHERLTQVRCGLWVASARAHVHTSFARWCLLARSSIADQGAILVYYNNYNRSKVKIIKEWTPTISLKMRILIKCDLVITMSIKAKLGPTYLIIYVKSNIDAVWPFCHSKMADKQERWRNKGKSCA